MRKIRSRVAIAGSFIALGLAFQNCQHGMQSNSLQSVMAAAPSVKVLSTGSVTALSFPGQPMEITPWIITNAGQQTIFFSTGFSGRCMTSGNFLTGTGTLTYTGAANCLIDTSSFISNYIWGTPGADAPLDGQYQSNDPIRSYNGIFSAHVIGNQIFSIEHGENENWLNPTGNNPAICSQNTVDPSIACFASPTLTPNGCATGIYNGTFQVCLNSYHAFVTMASRPLVGSGQVQELGPIIWPANGYADASGDIEIGVRQPSSIVNGGFLYVYYYDGSQGYAANGRGPGIKVARAAVQGSGVGPFYTYFDCPSHDESCFTDPALPSGFTINSIRQFYASQGGRSTDISQSARPDFINRFSVSRVNNTDYFLAVSLENGAVTFRSSKNLWSWGPPTVVPGISTNGFANTQFLYVNFLDSAGQGHSDIDAHDFYLMGTSPNETLSLVHLQIEIN